MREVLQQLLTSINSAKPVAYCRLVETRGSTPQKAGALMLVYPDGSQAGTLGGGCVEADVKRRALAVLDSGQAEVAKFQLDSDYGWDDGLICGGRMQVLIEPILSERHGGRSLQDVGHGGRSLQDATSAVYFEQLSRRADTGITEAVVFDAEASGLAAPAGYLFDTAGGLVGTLHVALDSPAAGKVRESLRPLATRPRPYAAQGVAFLPILPRCRLLIVGGGHVGQAVANLAADLDFDVWVVDDRADIISPERFPRAQRRIAGEIENVLKDIEITPDTYCLIVTRGHNHDEEALFHLAERGARYVGLIGSRRKIKLIYDDLLQQGISAESLAKVHAPLGIDIGSQTVPEIAVSICAELISHRNRAGVVPGRPARVEV